ncbi:MAG: hypothetical protein H0X13_11665 [Ramlibacter sp.]|nr:hypothetical protein [Ramlibacter sp.]
MQRLKGYTAGEVIGRHFSIFYTPEERSAGLPDFGLAEAARLGRYNAPVFLTSIGSCART